MAKAHSQSKRGEAKLKFSCFKYLSIKSIMSACQIDIAELCQFC